MDINIKKLNKERNNPSFENLSSLKKDLEKIEKIKSKTSEISLKSTKIGRKNLNKKKYLSKIY